MKVYFKLRFIWTFVSNCVLAAFFKTWNTVCNIKLRWLICAISPFRHTGCFIIYDTITWLHLSSTDDLYLILEFYLLNKRHLCLEVNNGKIYYVSTHFYVIYYVWHRSQSRFEKRKKKNLTQSYDGSIYVNKTFKRKKEDIWPSPMTKVRNAIAVL